MTTRPNPHATGELTSALARLLEDAGKALSMDQPEAAEQALDRALEMAPDHAEVHRLLGIAALMTGNHAKAIDNLRRALANHPNDAAINMTLGSVLFETGSHIEALAHLRRACELAPESAETWWNLGVALEFTSVELNLTDNMLAAREALARTVAIEPGRIKARNKLATTMLTMGDTRAAVTMLRGTLSRQPDCVDAWNILAGLQTEPLSNDDVTQLQALLARPNLPEEVRASLTFALARALEDQRDHTAAFDALRNANASKRRLVAWNGNEERARVDAIAQVFARPIAAATDAELGKEIIFVVSVPRSGSTLTEQILASHPAVQGGGETRLLIDILKEESHRLGRSILNWVPAATRADWQRLGEAYLERVRPLRNQRPRFTDKTVDNWGYVGVALAMLPGAHVVNARRNPLETCFACYRRLFVEGSSLFSYDLDDMVDYYAGYERLSALWRQRYPERFLDNDYEALQEDPEGRIRRLLSFCELPFDAACLAFHRTPRTVLTISSSQVREPLRRNTARSAQYGAMLDPLRAKLRAAGVSVERA